MDKIQLDGLGAHIQWERNHKAANRKGVPESERCQHCQKPMADGNGWYAQWAADDCLYPLDAPAPGCERIRLGNECARRWQKGLTKADIARFFIRITDVEG